MFKIKSLFLLALALTFTFIFFRNFKANGLPDNDFCLRGSYDAYKKNFMQKDGRIIDPDRNNITTSEGQSYIMLRSLVAEDRDTFDLAYSWAKNNLQRQDKLFAWLWGKDDEGNYKILDYNSASDADVDIAFALILAYEKWGEYEYLMEAIPVINSIWNNETKRINNYLILMPGVNQTLAKDRTEVNPSYFSPYAFRFFQKYDELHDWSYLIDSSYYYIMQSCAKTQTGLPPNWFLIGEDNSIILEESPRSDFSYDAIRVFVRIYLDYIRTGEKRALPIFEKTRFLVDQYKKTGKFYVNYKANGELADENIFIGAVAILTPAIQTYDVNTAKKIYRNITKAYFEDENYWNTPKDYYAKNLLWFGCYLYNKNSTQYKKMHSKRIKGY